MKGHWTKGKRRNEDAGDWSAIRLDIQSLIDRYYLVGVRSARALADAMGLSDRTVRKHLDGTMRPSLDLQDRYRAWVVEQRCRVGGVEGTPLPQSSDGARGRASERATDSCVGPGNPARTFIEDERNHRYRLSSRQIKEMSRYNRLLYLMLPAPGPEVTDLIGYVQKSLEIPPGHVMADGIGHYAVRVDRTVRGTGTQSEFGMILPEGDTRGELLPVVRVIIGRPGAIARVHRGASVTRPQFPGGC